VEFIYITESTAWTTHCHLADVVKESVQLYLYPAPEPSWPVLMVILPLPLLHYTRNHKSSRTHTKRWTVISNKQVFLRGNIKYHVTNDQIKIEKNNT